MVRTEQRTNKWGSGGCSMNTNFFTMSPRSCWVEQLGYLSQNASQDYYGIPMCDCVFVHVSV